MPKTLFPEFVSDVMEVAGEKEDNYSRKELYESKAGGMQYGCTRKEQGQKRLPQYWGFGFHNRAVLHRSPEKISHRW